jgi:hypothetical protein
MGFFASAGLLFVIHCATVLALSMEVSVYLRPTSNYGVLASTTETVMTFSGRRGEKVLEDRIFLHDGLSAEHTAFVMVKIFPADGTSGKTTLAPHILLPLGFERGIPPIALFGGGGGGVCLFQNILGGEDFFDFTHMYRPFFLCVLECRPCGIVTQLTELDYIGFPLVEKVIIIRDVPPPTVCNYLPVFVLYDNILLGVGDAFVCNLHRIL